MSFRNTKTPNKPTTPAKWLDTEFFIIKFK